LPFVDIVARAARIAAALQAEGWCHQPDFLPAELVAALRTDAQAQRNRFAPAAVGRGGERQRLSEQRNDSTLWLTGEGAAQRDFLARLDCVRQTLNSELFLGLMDYEAHYAHYAAGQFYRRHLDAFRQREANGLPQRIVSSVFYLNEAWRPGDGGELVVWRDAIELARIAPLGGSAVFFLSAEFPHEVLPARADRFSIAGWFRNRGR
jgi:SM-20-related protein